MKDPIIEEVRAHRMEHTRQFQSDLHSICADLREFQKSIPAAWVKTQPKLKADGKYESGAGDSGRPESPMGGGLET